MKKLKVLIADDDRCIRTALKKRLSAIGLTVLESPDGLGAVDQACRERVDAIILDYEMPNGDGCSVARVIRRECDAPIIFLSGHGRETFRATVSALANTYYLCKPFDAPRLLDLLGTLLGGLPRPTAAAPASG